MMPLIGCIVYFRTRLISPSSTTRATDKRENMGLQTVISILLLSAGFNRFGSEKYANNNDFAVLFQFPGNLR